MSEPLSDVVALLQPCARVAKVVSGVGAWRVRRDATGQPFYCLLLDGSSRLSVDGRDLVILHAGDFVLIPAARGFTMSSMQEMGPGDVDAPTVVSGSNEIRHGDPNVPADVRLLVGHFGFGSPDADLLVSLLPELVHVRGDRRLSAIVELVTDEARSDRPARDAILQRLLEALLLEALRSGARTSMPAGLLRGLGDERLASALRRLHEDPTKGWTVESLAREASLSRSAFFIRFRNAMGVAPMEYVLSWRMALAKNLLRQSGIGMQEIAERVGYGSASAFSTAFTRFVGVPPSRYVGQGTA
ncbi:AraC family transcriptional regulator [Mesorhizobium australicum]|uniref:AraC-type DNA-binding protein n=1 Tax=Mesorhizobium australicum TaxID=536018 RepID=A0A1X7PLD8_9HYPH|nr:AraC family transcriptional regulator [Mesorhizobium australicum]SMH52310.1 AraC-type DNA-binding protein [Mesorhizobium australicum]